MGSICENLQRVRGSIAAAEKKFGRQSGSVQLLAASKTRTVAEIKQAIDCGQYLFGESYVQEALEKITALTDEKVEWHFIGPIQSNKTKLIAQYFSWAHSIDREKIVDRLNEQRSCHLPSLNVCIEVNISNEASKAGVMPQDVTLLAQKIVTKPNLKLRGLMAIPEPSDNFVKQRECFKKLADLYHELNAAGFSLDTLSMGMTDDFAAAIAEGATIVRIGTAIFGPRN